MIPSGSGNNLQNRPDYNHPHASGPPPSSKKHWRKSLPNFRQAMKTVVGYPQSFFGRGRLSAGGKPTTGNSEAPQISRPASSQREENADPKHHIKSLKLALEHFEHNHSLTVSNEPVVCREANAIAVGLRARIERLQETPEPHEIQKVAEIVVALNFLLAIGAHVHSYANIAVGLRGIAGHAGQTPIHIHIGGHFAGDAPLEQPAEHLWSAIYKYGSQTAKFQTMLLFELDLGSTFINCANQWTALGSDLGLDAIIPIAFPDVAPLMPKHDAAHVYSLKPTLMGSIYAARKRSRPAGLRD